MTGTVISPSFTSTAGGTFTTASGNDLNLVYPDGRSLFIKEAGTTHVTIDNTGKVGIGKSPIRTLDIKQASGDPSIRLESASYSADVITLRNGDGRIGFGNDAITVLSTGKVGIGTASPTKKLSVSGTFSAVAGVNDSGITVTGGTGSQSYAKIHLSGAGTALDSIRISNDGGHTICGTEKVNGGGLAGSTLSYASVFGSIGATAAHIMTNNTTKMTVLSDGKVGIGTTSPSTALQVSGTVTATSFSGAGVIDTVTNTDPAITTNPSAVGHIWLNTITGNIFTCTRNVSNENIWINSTDPGRHVMYKKSNGTADLFGDNSDLIHLRMNEQLATSGVLRDYSDKNTASVDANVQFSGNSKFSSHSASFHGNGEIRIPFMSGAFTRSSAFTVSLWITRKGDVHDGSLPFCINGTSSTSGRGVMVSGNNIYRVSTTAPNTMHGSLGASFTVNDGDHFIVIGYTDATSRLYKNGSIVGTTGAATSGHSNVSGAAGGTFGGIGNVYNPTGYDSHTYYNCSINNIRIFNKAINGTEAATLYAEGY
jgi:hypothetical protein